MHPAVLTAVLANSSLSMLISLIEELKCAVNTSRGAGVLISYTANMILLILSHSISHHANPPMRAPQVYRHNIRVEFSAYVHVPLHLLYTHLSTVKGDV